MDKPFVSVDLNWIQIPIYSSVQNTEQATGSDTPHHSKPCSWIYTRTQFAYYIGYDHKGMAFFPLFVATGKKKKES